METAQLICLIAVLLTSYPTTHGYIPDCAFEDTVRLDDNQYLANGSYMYENVVIPPNFIGHYRYDMISGENVSVPSHARGCVCKIKPCVQFCCHPGAVIMKDSKCEQKLANELTYSPSVNVKLRNGSHTTLNVLADFVLKIGAVSCTTKYALEPQQFDEDNWWLFENGSLYREMDSAELKRLEYCLTPLITNGEHFLNPLLCVYEQEPSWTRSIVIVAMTISIPFFFLTVIVFLIVPELRNTNGKCLLCYLLFMAISFIMMVWIHLKEERFADGTCEVFGYTLYYLLMCAFFWASVISYDLWRHFKTGKDTSGQFWLYSIYACGVPVILTAIVIIAQSLDLPFAFSPGVGEVACWIKVNDWSAMIYFYGPKLIILIFNMTVFCIIIKTTHQALANTSTPSRKSHQDSLIYFRLIMLMGLTWFFEVSSYLYGSEDAVIFLLTDLFNALIGVIIFILFVLNQPVLHSLKLRICGKQNSANFNTNVQDFSPDDFHTQNLDETEHL